MQFHSSSIVRRVAGMSGTLIVVALPFAVARAQEKVDLATIERIKSEEMSNSHVMEIMSWLSDVYGPRLTWSPNTIRARDWAMGEMKKWGLANVHEETWDTPAGLGWENQKFSFMATSPGAVHRRGGAAGVVGRAQSARRPGARCWCRPGCFDELKEKYAGKLKNAFVMTAPPRDSTGEPISRDGDAAHRLGARRDGGGAARARRRSRRRWRSRWRGGRAAAAIGDVREASSSAIRSPRRRRSRAAVVAAAADSAAWWPQRRRTRARCAGSRSRGLGDPARRREPRRRRHRHEQRRVARQGAPRVAAVHVAQESYGRIARMVEKSVPVTLELNMQNKFYPENKTSFNVIGEIPGTDPRLKDEVVMIGAHFDSWHSGTGRDGQRRRLRRDARGDATSQNARPQAAPHDPHRPMDRRRAGPARLGAPMCGSTSARATATGFHPTDEQKKFAAYFNVDNGSGKIRGVYLQGIEAERPIFDAWMDPFNGMGMKTLTISNTGGTDHLSYIGVGLPGFQFIQDPLDYGNVTHHTNQDVYERLQPDDMKFNSAVVASFAWQAAQRDEKLPRPPEPAGRGRGAVP